MTDELGRIKYHDDGNGRFKMITLCEDEGRLWIEIGSYKENGDGVYNVYNMKDDFIVLEDEEDEE